MANGQFRLGKQAGGTLGLVFPDGVSNTEVVLPESGNLVSVDTAVTDNAIARYDGTTGKLQDSGVIIDDSGNITSLANKYISFGGTSNSYFYGDSAGSTEIYGGNNIRLVTAGAERVRIDSAGNGGWGVTPSAWTGVKALSIGGTGTIQGDVNTLALSIGVKGNTYTGYGSTYDVTGQPVCAYALDKGTGKHFWRTAPAGTAGQPITWTNAMTLDTNGNLLLTSGTGALGYGAGAGGTVTQLTSKSTDVTLNKPSGTIIMHNGIIGANQSAYFCVNNSMFGRQDIVALTGKDWSSRYMIENTNNTTNAFCIRVTNITAESYSDPIEISFAIIKGVNA